MENRRGTNTNDGSIGAQDTPIDRASNAIIPTNVVRQFLAGMDLFLEQGKTSSAIGVAMGSAGIGKTVALSSFQRSLIQEMYPLQEGIMLTASPFMTPYRLASQLLQLLNASTYPSIRDPGRSLSAMLRQQKIHLLAIDNADLLKKETWELLHVLLDETPCSLVLVGHPVLHHLLKQCPYLMDRVSIVLDLHPVSFDEVLHVILPHLARGRWVFHAGNERDRHLAQEIWSHVGPSLRRLEAVFDVAATIAHAQQEPISHANLYQALQWIPRSPDSHQIAMKEETPYSGSGRKAKTKHHIPKEMQRVSSSRKRASLVKERGHESF